MQALLRHLRNPLAAIAAVAAVAALTPAAARAIDQADPAETAIAPLPVDSAVTIGTLDNGLRYYIRANGEPERRAELRLVVKAGSLQEDDDQRGLAHFLEHMAFNGTKHFKKHELRDYLESIGMRFGAGLNAATSYDNTTYRLTIPTDVEGALEKAFLILEDWSRGITLEESEVDAERGVILSEERARRGVGTRVRAHTDSILLGDSRYLNRLPIGVPETITKASRKTIARFYDDWYRPDLMAVVVVGDVDVARVEKLIEKHFKGLKARGKKRERESYTIPAHSQPLVSVVTDPELTGSSVQLIQKFKPAPINSVERTRAGIVQSMFTSILNQRLREIANRSNSPFLGASTDFSGYVGGMHIQTVVSASVREGEMLEGFRAALTEVERIAQHGIKPEELSREKQAARSRYRQALITRSKITSAQYAGDYISHFLSGRTPATVEASVALARALVDQITAEEVAALASNWKSRENLAIVALLPTSQEESAPTAEQLLAVLDEVSSMKLDAAGSDTITRGPAELMATLPTPGTVVKERQIREVGITEWTLSNETRVILKPTDFTPDQVLVSGYGWGGTSLLAEDQLRDATLAGSLPAISGLASFSSTDLRNAVVGKLLSIGMNLGGYTQSVSGRSTVRDLETFLQLLHLHFTSPRVDDEAIQAWKKRVKVSLEGRVASPEAHFADTLRTILSQGHPRSRVLTVAEIDSIDTQRALEIYRERFADAGGFTFVIVGDFEPDSIRPLIERYVGGLPSQPGNRGWRDTGVRAPSGVVEKEFRFGREPRARIAIVFNGPFTHTEDEQFALGAMASILSNRLRDRLREALGGTYSVSVHPRISAVPERTYSVHIGFDAAPSRVEEMRRAVFEEIEELRAQGPTSEEVDKVRQEHARQLELSLKSNSFWLRLITSFDQTERPLADLARYGEAWKDRMDAKLIHTMAQKYLSPSRYVQVTQLPAD